MNVLLRCPTSCPSSRETCPAVAAGEELVETMLGGTVEDRAAQMAALGIGMDIASSMAADQGPEMVGRSSRRTARPANPR